MTKAELVRRMRNRAEQLPWLLNLTQIIQVSPGSGHQGLHRGECSDSLAPSSSGASPKLSCQTTAFSPTMLDGTELKQQPRLP